MPPTSPELLDRVSANADVRTGRPPRARRRLAAAAALAVSTLVLTPALVAGGPAGPAAAVPSAGSSTKTSALLQPTKSSKGKPGPSNTGVPKGTKLKVHKGDLTITKDGTVIDGRDIRGYVYVKADNVVIKRSVVRGGTVKNQDRALIMAWWGAKNLKVTDSTLKASTPSLRLDGLSGSGFTADRLNISGVVDPVKVIGGNVTVKRSYLHNSTYSSKDPNQRDGRTHDDSIQITGGSKISIVNNTLEDAHNAAIMMSSARYKTGDITISGNWIGDGACTINITTADKGAIRDLQIRDNSFGRGKYGKVCPIRIPRSTDASMLGNRFWDKSLIKPQRF
ncbi:right-handed parallel beta-helix repeat-containing protein [Desertihabitans aurantiacus]|uniref:right-handed parallel beta-helix repeat-containing protein n=1 Tax=Desertihabitans aurantiacus TaxID=2282477 RepID=UPI0018E5271C|nr:right-handed parallel beta-helix repeat-containing protein [Desertihabitans aurantiacus]